ncbi:hypothetical protein SGLAM104S_07005 [Streptomyces glaucescens]
MQLGAAAAADLGGNGFDGEPAVALALFPGGDVQPPQAGAVDGAVAVPVDAEEGHQEADRAALVGDQAGPGDPVRVDVGLGEGLHHRGDGVFLVGADPDTGGGVEIAGRQLFEG